MSEPSSSFLLVTDAQIDLIVERAVKRILATKTTHTPDLPDSIGINEACIEIGLGKATMYQLTHRGDIPCSHFGKKLVFSRKAIRSWKDHNTLAKVTGEDFAIAALKKQANKKTK